MVATPLPSSPTRQAPRVVELHLGGCVGAVAELVLQPLQADGVALPSGRMRGIRKQVRPLLGLRQHQERVRHRRRHEPFVPGDAVFAVAVAGFGARGVGAHVRAALLLRHAHADRDAALLGRGRAEIAVVGARQEPRRPFAEQVRRMPQRRQRRVRHGHRAEMPAFRLRRHVERAARARCRSPASLSLAVEGGAMQAGEHRAPHQRVIGRVEIHLVDALAACVVALQLRRVAVGEPGEFPRLVRAPESPEIREVRPARRRGIRRRRGSAADRIRTD